MGSQVNTKRQVVRMSRNLHIVLCGMDGTGKSTLGQKIQNQLKSMGIMSEFHHGHGYAISEKSFSLNENKVRKFRYILMFALPLAYFDNLLSYRRYRKKISKQTLICDRYFYDKVCRLMFYGICPAWLSGIYVKILPRPDIVFFLDIPAQLAYERKHEYTLEEYENFRHKYLSLAEKLKAPVLDTSRSIEHCCELIFQELNRKVAPQRRYD